MLMLVVGIYTVFHVSSEENKLYLTENIKNNQQQTAATSETIAPQTQEITTTQEKTNPHTFSFIPLRDRGYALSFTNRQNIPYTIPLLVRDSNGIRYGSRKDDLHFMEGYFNPDNPSNALFTITPYDYIILSDEATGITHILRYQSIDQTDHSISFDDLSGDSLVLYYQPSALSGILGRATLQIEEKSYEIYIKKENDILKLAIDQNGDGSINGEKLNLYLYDGFTIDLDQLSRINPRTQTQKLSN